MKCLDFSCNRVRRTPDGKLLDLDESRDCSICWGAAMLSGRRPGAGPVSPASVQKVTLAIIEDPCLYEGAVLYECNSCSSESREQNNIRECGNPDMEWTRCTRGLNNGADRDVGTCVGCSGRPRTVTEILRASGSDKYTHGYGPMYTELLEHRTGDVLELGVLGGASLTAWSRILPRVAIVGADNDPVCAAVVSKIKNATFVKLDVRDAGELTAFAAANRGRFGLIVDDSTHRANDQLCVRKCLWNAVAPGGVMVIEDVPNDSAAAALGGRVWDFRTEGKWDSRAVSLEKPRFRPSDPPRVLFASQYLRRDGAPILLANLVTRIRDVIPRVYSPIPGPLGAVYAQAGIPLSFELNLDGVDLLVANTIASASVAAIRAARDRGIPAVWMIHESDPGMCDNLPEVLEVIDYPVKLIFPCRTTADVYAGWRTRGVEIIPTVIPPVPFRARTEPNGTFVILTAGRDEPRKGQSDIRRAIEGMSGVELRTMADLEDPWTEYSTADLYICSSRVEAYPLALQEAKAYGLPVITTPVFGCEDIIKDFVHGRYYDPGDVSFLRAIIENIRTFPDQYNRPLDHLPSHSATVDRYAAIFRDAAGKTPAAPPELRVVYHTAAIGDVWRDVVTEQLIVLAESGLRRVYGSHVGGGADWLAGEANRLGVDLIPAQYDPDVKAFEVPAMRLIERLARSGDAPILYLHAKGVSHPTNETLWGEWRRLMNEELVRRWREHLPELDRHDAVGVNWWTEKTHFSGNFWMVRADWIRKLPPFDSYYRDRYSCERWLGEVKSIRAKSLCCTNLRFWEDDRDWLTKYWASKDGPNTPGEDDREGRPRLSH